MKVHRETLSVRTTGEKREDVGCLPDAPVGMPTGMPLGTLRGYLRSCAPKIDQEIEAVLESEVDDAWIRGAISYHLGWATTDFRQIPAGNRRSAGKKLRAALALLCYQAAALELAGPDADIDPEPAAAFGAAIEIIHNYSLIHDDIEDHDRLRRGQPTLWSLCGQAQALNGGDCLHALAYICLEQLPMYGIDQVRALELVGVLARASIEMAIGQRWDLAYETEPDVSIEMYLQMIAGKTGALAACATYGGALLALGTRGRTVRRILARYAEYGRHIGLGFQIRDDILGIWGSEDETGKPAGSDIRRRKKTLPVLLALREAPRATRERLRRLYALDAEFSGDQESEIRLLLDRCGAAVQAQCHAEFHRQRAVDALADAAGGRSALRDNPFLAILEQLAGFVTTRDR